MGLCLSNEQFVFSLVLRRQPPCPVLRRLIGNSYMMTVHPRPQSDAKTFDRVNGGIPEDERTSGTIMIYGIKIER